MYFNHGESLTEYYDKVVIGAGAAGLYYSFLQGDDLSILIIEKNKVPGKKILVSGGGRCNYTNEKILKNSYFSTVASEEVNDTSNKIRKYIAKYPPEKIIKIFKEWGINPILKSRGQLFSSIKAKGVRDALINKILNKNTTILYNTSVHIDDIKYSDKVFSITTNNKNITCESLIVASGGLSFPKLGVSKIGYQIAEKFGHNVTELSPALVPLQLKESKNRSKLSGISLPVQIRIRKNEIYDDLLFTYKGISGPAVLRISNYWNKGDKVSINFIPNENLTELIQNERSLGGKKTIKTILKAYLPSSFVDLFFESNNLQNTKIAGISKKDLKIVVDYFTQLSLTPTDSEGFDKAEVTSGGVSINELDEYLQSKFIPNLFFIGEVCDVTGDLGGFNFQWAWTSAYLASLYK